MTELVFEEESYQIRGAIFEVYREMGCGFLEAVYQECLEKEFRRQSIPFVARKELLLVYKGERLSQV
jgi:GxxExxY protein